MTQDRRNNQDGSDHQDAMEADRLRREALAALRRTLSTHPDLAEMQDFIDTFDKACIQPTKSAEAHESDNELGADDDGDFGRFTLSRLLGEGGFGTVFLAHDPMLDRKVAMKLPRLEVWASAELYRRFMREGRAVAILDHPNIIPVHESGEIAGVGYIVTAYCAGPSLAEWLSGLGRWCSPNLAAEIVMQITRAVQHAHEHGVLHRDIKPANILLEPTTNTTGVAAFIPRLTDFGLAKHLNEVAAETVGGAQAGTPRYMAPEQLRDDGQANVGIYTDIYALGVVLYELLAGVPPFDDENQLVLARKIREQPPPATSIVRPDIPRDLETICFKCLEKEPGRRYLTARDLADDLQRFLNGHEVLARPLNFADRWIRRCRTHRTVTTLCALLAVATLAGLAGVFYQWRSANRYATAVEASLVQAEQGLVNMSWVVEEMNQWSSNTDPFFAGNGERLRHYYERMLARPAPLRPSYAYAATMQSFRARVAELANKPDESERYFEQTIRSWAELIRLEPDNNDYRQALAANLFSYGVHLRRHNKMDRPLAQPYEERVLYDYLLTLEPKRGSVVGDFAGYLIERGKALACLGQQQNAQNQLRLAKGLLGHAFAQFPQDLQFKWLLGKAGFYLACNTRRVGTANQAIEQFTDCNIIFEDMIAGGLGSAECLFYRAEASRLQAACMRDSGQIDKAVTMFETAMHFLLHLEKDGGEPSQTLNLLASTSMNLAELYEKQGKPEHCILNRERFCRYAGKAVLQRTAANAHAKRLPHVLLELARWDLEGGREGDAIGRLIFACRVSAYISPSGDAQVDQRIAWAECLALRADISKRGGQIDDALMHHRAAIDVLTQSRDADSTQKGLSERLEFHRAAISELEATRA